ncbi:transmembrane protein 179B-like [Coregonus clupeaformis]|uniref:transmembrane protein 179B-like n=1 Tax=Coregonus clupeaformis TaxID=59861 RepID=UPI001BE0EE24|nr:transmembrane protein 179B-like [Coregonus clupeaformis]
MMEIPKIPWLLLIEMGLYASCFVCGIVTAASLTITQGSFSGLCMLYGTVNHNSSSDSILVQTSSAPSLCYFVSAISVCVAVFCFSMSLYWIYTCCLDGVVNRERLWLNVTLVVCGVFLFFLLVTGCVLKIGRDSLCDSVLHTVPNITSCEEAQSRTWISPYTGTQFYTGLYRAGTAVWVNFFFWILIGVLVVIQRGQGSEFRMTGADPLATPSETEPFFPRPAKPQ